MRQADSRTAATDVARRFPSLEEPPRPWWAELPILRGLWAEAFAQGYLWRIKQMRNGFRVITPEARH